MPNDDGPDPGPDGAVVVELTDDRVVLDLTVTPTLHQPYGIVHGGVYCALAERAARLGAQRWLGEAGRACSTVVGTQFLRAARDGTVRAEATPVHRGRSQQLWTVRLTEAGGRLMATSEVRLANLGPVPA